MRHATFGCAGPWSEPRCIRGQQIDVEEALRLLLFDGRKVEADADRDQSHDVPGHDQEVVERRDGRFPVRDTDDDTENVEGEDQAEHRADVTTGRAVGMLAAVGRVTRVVHGYLTILWGLQFPASGRRRSDPCRAGQALHR